MSLFPEPNFHVTTPCPGMMMRRTTNGAAVVWLHYTADPTFTKERQAIERKKYTSEAIWQQEMEIQYEARSGQLVYADFNKDIHVIPHAKIPQKLCRYMAIDPHPRTPHAFLWIGLDAWSDWYVYREMWPSVSYAQARTVKDTDKELVYTVKKYAETVAWHEGNRIDWRNPETQDEYGIYQKAQGTSGEYIIERFMDQAGKAFRASGEEGVHESYAQRYDRFGLQCSDPWKGHKAGEDAIRELLTVRQHQAYGTWPRLHISERCPELIMEMLKYRYKATRRSNEEKELHQEGVEARCHMIDLLRYLATSPNLIYIRSLES